MHTIYRYGIVIVLLSFGCALPMRDKLLQAAAIDLVCSEDQLSVQKRSDTPGQKLSSALVTGCKRKGAYQYDQKKGWLVDETWYPEQPVAIKQKIKENTHQFASCYKQEFRRINSTEGSISTKFTVDKDGKVEKAIIMNSAFEGMPLEYCVIDKILSMEFPPQTGPTTITHQFNFKVKEKK